MAAHRWDTEPAQILPSRLTVRRRRERQAAGLPPESAGRRLDSALPDETPDGIQAAEQPAALPRRWRFPLRAAVMFACLLVAAAVAIPLIQNREPHETIAVELGAGVDTAEGGVTSIPGSDQPALGLPGTDLATGPAQNPSDGAPPGELPGSPERTTATSPEFVVHVAGAVAAPGIVRIKSGGRVADAVGAAGGALPEADLTLVNLAALMEDGSMVVIPAIGSDAAGPAVASAPFGPSGPENPSGPGVGYTPGYASGVGGGAAGGVTGGRPAAGPVNLNTATDAELQTLPRVGPVLAARIVAWRTDHGRYTRPEDLDAVPGIGEAMLAALLPLVTV
ncbi:helix-hairpin-helix domain-containing protein [Arthrobacter sp. Sa2BUA2]|uniref:Helix-hairpin-helix domain-containing protein n=1 Tax=Arthrobacter pullicola TaxID=2762224 RepID=A0ABR8YHC0_9MICC|nr:helix-hairpin-helix domain-containing protein [Arthrobacter pullicola]MBD8043605.1 helix-hairpin-helix domain-containing protein [Arthrobacter pullicola]